MIYCQSCLTPNDDELQVCRKCGSNLLVMGGNQQWEQIEQPRVSMEDHFLERISILEDSVNSMMEHMARLAESIENIDRNGFVTRSGLVSLVETLKESNLLREDLLYQRWEATIAEQMEDARLQERFAQMRGRFLALYRGSEKKRAAFHGLVEEADFLIYSDRFNESIEVLEKALQLDRKNYELAFYLGEYFQNQGVNARAREFLEIAVAANPDHADSLFLLALMCFYDGEEDESESLLLACLELNGFNRGALLTLGSLYTSQERYDEAMPYLERLNEMRPEAQAYFLMGMGARAEGRKKDAIKFLQKAAELDPEHEDAIFCLGMAYLERGWTRKARKCFSRALQLNPNNIEYQEASWSARPSSKPPGDLDPDSRETLEFAEQLYREGKYKQALPHYRQLLKKHPSNHLLWCSFAALNFSLRRFEEAIKVTRTLMEMTIPDSARQLAFTIQMESFRALNRLEEAIECLDRMVEVFPDGPGRAIADYGLALTMADLGHDLKEAEKLAENALALSPPEFRHNVLDAKGWVCFKQGRYEEALELVESALSMRETVNHLYHYGMILLALNLEERASKVYERALEMRSSNTQMEDYISTSIHREMARAGNYEDQMARLGNGEGEHESPTPKTTG